MKLQLFVLANATSAQTSWAQGRTERLSSAADVKEPFCSWIRSCRGHTARTEIDLWLSCHSDWGYNQSVE